jgi:hypothetical protein
VLEPPLVIESQNLRCHARNRELGLEQKGAADRVAEQAEGDRDQDEDEYAEPLREAA